MSLFAVPLSLSSHELVVLRIMAALFVLLVVRGMRLDIISASAVFIGEDVVCIGDSFKSLIRHATCTCYVRMVFFSQSMELILDSDSIRFLRFEKFE